MNMLFGLKGAASASFQRVMHKALRDVQFCVVAYIDDILICRPSWETHLTHLWWILEALRQAGLAANLKKSKLGQKTVQYLGFCIRQGKFWAIPNKVAAPL